MLRLRPSRDTILAGIPSCLSSSDEDQNMKRCLVVGIVFLAVNACSLAKVCTREQAIQAETEADRLSTWPAIPQSYGKYAQCDDGAISEGYSFSVAKMLSGRWEEIAELHKLTTQDPSFHAFVLKHVDGTMTAEQREKILDLARNHCPHDLHDLCQDIYRKALE